MAIFNQKKFWWIPGACSNSGTFTQKIFQWNIQPEIWNIFRWGLFSMLQVWFINYKRTIMDRFACPDKSIAKSTKLKLFLLPPKMYNGASNWNKFTPRPNSSKTFCIFQSRAVRKYHYPTRTWYWCRDIANYVDIELLLVLQFYTFDYWYWYCKRRLSNILIDIDNAWA